MVITSRHHDGFSMYDTALSDYKVTRTPFGRDPLRELADACARLFPAGNEFFFILSRS